MKLFNGDMRDVLRTLPENSIDSGVMDPPYHLTTVSRYGATSLDNENDSNARRAKAPAAPDALARLARGFMGKAWDGGDVAFQPDTWREVLRVLKPGAHLFAFSGTRTYHRMACAIEDAGFEIRDQFGWTYGSGFPKSHDISKGIDATEQATRWQGWGTAVKPAWEPIVLARKPISEKTVAANVMRWGTGGLNIDACRITVEDVATYRANASGDRGHDQNRGRDMDYRLTAGSASKIGRFPANLIHDGSDEVTALLDAAARFFYCAKADKKDRAGSAHPTVKPVALMRYLCRMITPAGGMVLDGFAGSGTTVEAARAEGFDAIGIEMEREYFYDMQARVGIIPRRHHDLFGPAQPWDTL